ncbi:MAG: hypothetical protein AAFQ42_15140 [Pseudomonadota bacterium]
MSVAFLSVKSHVVFWLAAQDRLVRYARSAHPVKLWGGKRMRAIAIALLAMGLLALPIAPTVPSARAQTNAPTSVGVWEARRSDDGRLFARLRIARDLFGSAQALTGDVTLAAGACPTKEPCDEIGRQLPLIEASLLGDLTGRADAGFTARWIGRADGLPTTIVHTHPPARSPITSYAYDGVAPTWFLQMLPRALLPDELNVELRKRSGAPVVLAMKRIAPLPPGFQKPGPPTRTISATVRAFGGAPLSTAAPSPVWRLAQRDGAVTLRREIGRGSTLTYTGEVRQKEYVLEAWIGRAVARSAPFGWSEDVDLALAFDRPLVIFEAPGQSNDRYGWRVQAPTKAFFDRGEQNRASGSVRSDRVSALLANPGTYRFSLRRGKDRARGELVVTAAPVQQVPLDLDGPLDARGSIEGFPGTLRLRRQLKLAFTRTPDASVGL